jgi:hypothetical protein
MPLDLRVTAAHRRCAGLPLDDEGLGLRAWAYLPESVAAICYGYDDLSSPRARSVALFVWGAIDREAAAVHRADPERARALRTWQDAIAPVESIRRIIDSALRVGRTRISEKVLREAARNLSSSAQSRGRRASVGANSGPSLTFVSEGTFPSPGPRTLHAPPFLNGLMRGRRRSLLKCADEEMKGLRVRLPELERRLSLHRQGSHPQSRGSQTPGVNHSQRRPKPSAKARPMNPPFDFSHLASSRAPRSAGGSQARLTRAGEQLGAATRREVSAIEERKRRRLAF